MIKIKIKIKIVKIKIVKIKIVKIKNNIMLLFFIYL